MKIFEIIDAELELSMGVLLYYKKEKTCIIELQEYLDEWTAPLLFTSYVKQHIYTIPRDISRLWVQERVIPSGRQNIKEILAHHNLKEYDEMTFLEISDGKCSQDSLYIKKIESLPEYVLVRTEHNIEECVMSEKQRLLCFFVDGTVKKIDLADICEVEGVDKIIKNDKLYQSGKVGTGGYFITFNDSIDLPSRILYERGERIPLCLGDFTAFVQNNVIDTTQSCNILQCSRQNVAYMVSHQQMIPIKEDVRGNLYLKGDVIRNQW